MRYIVVIKHKGDAAQLDCDTLEQAMLLKQAYLNWGGYDLVTIERANDETI